jgi:hypothetical protein
LLEEEGEEDGGEAELEEVFEVEGHSGQKG